MKNKITRLFMISALIIFLLSIISIIPNSPGDDEPPELGYKVTTIFRV